MVIYTCSEMVKCIDEIFVDFNMLFSPQQCVHRIDYDAVLFKQLHQHKVTKNLDRAQSSLSQKKEIEEGLINICQTLEGYRETLLANPTGNVILNFDITNIKVLVNEIIQDLIADVDEGKIKAKLETFSAYLIAIERGFSAMESHLLDQVAVLPQDQYREPDNNEAKVDMNLPGQVSSEVNHPVYQSVDRRDVSIMETVKTYFYIEVAIKELAKINASCSNELLELMLTKDSEDKKLNILLASVNRELKKGRSFYSCFLRRKTADEMVMQVYSEIKFLLRCGLGPEKDNRCSLFIGKHKLQHFVDIVASIIPGYRNAINKVDDEPHPVRRQ